MGPMDLTSKSPYLENCGMPFLLMDVVVVIGGKMVNHAGVKMGQNWLFIMEFSRIMGGE